MPQLIKVYFVHLRRPGWNDSRDDPYWEFGSFGCTGCHSRNLFHTRHADDLDGARLAFVQGGKLGFRLLFLSPPVKIHKWRDRYEARWEAEMPFKYTEAPVLARNNHRSDFPKVVKFAARTNRTTLEGGFSSRIRSRTLPLPDELARELVRIYQAKRSQASPAAIASSYVEALPYAPCPPKAADRHREASYQERIRILAAADRKSRRAANSRCMPARCR